MHKKSKAECAKEWLLNEIRIGNFPRGAALPPERELADQLGVSYMTLRKAVGALVDERLLERNHGSGTFVRNEISENKVQKQLGVVIPAWSAPENLDFIMHISEACEQQNWLIKIIYARSWKERTILDLWQNCDAIVASAVEPITEMPEILISKIRGKSKPVVFQSVCAEQYGADSVYYPSDSKVEEVAAQLHELGHRRILQIDQIVSRNGMRQTLHQFFTAFQECFSADYPDVDFNTELFSLELPNFELAHRTILREFAARQEILRHYTAIICPLSFYWGVVSGLYAAGLRVPEDISILTFGDRQEAEFYHPRPTTLSARLRDHAFGAVELVRWREQNPDEPPRTLKLKAEFIPGETLGKVPHDQSQYRHSSKTRSTKQTGVLA